MGRQPRSRLVVGQSGGPTAVINASLVGVIRAAQVAPGVDWIWGARNGVQGALTGDFLDLTELDDATLAMLARTPSAALGSCRFKVSPDDVQTLVTLFARHDVRYFVYIGGNDSADTAHRLAMAAADRGYALTVTCVPKTIDNDLAGMDHCPGYGSAARFLSQATADAGRDTEAMRLWDPIKIIEVMGRNAGWLAAATALAAEGDPSLAPHLIYLPERPLIADRFLSDVERVYRDLGHAVIVVAETVRDEAGDPIGQARAAADAFGHPQLAGAAATLSALIVDKLGLKTRFDKPGTIQRMSIACASTVDLAEAEAAGGEAVRLALAGQSGVMVALNRVPGPNYQLSLGAVPLQEVANAQRTMPANFINDHGNGVTPAFRDYARPLLGGPLLPYARLSGGFSLWDAT